MENPIKMDVNNSREDRNIRYAKNSRYANERREASKSRDVRNFGKTGGTSTAVTAAKRAETLATCSMARR
jgi:hypothetical protein